jgi:hypothetical protein
MPAVPERQLPRVLAGRAHLQLLLPYLLGGLTLRDHGLAARDGPPVLRRSNDAHGRTRPHMLQFEYECAD